MPAVAAHCLAYPKVVSGAKLRILRVALARNPSAVDVIPAVGAQRECSGNDAIYVSTVIATMNSGRLRTITEQAGESCHGLLI
jgi:hypothetical protein